MHIHKPLTYTHTHIEIKLSGVYFLLLLYLYFEAGIGNKQTILKNEYGMFIII